MMLNLLHPSKGAAFVMGGTISDPKISSRVGYLPEESYLYKYLTSRETLDFYGRIFGLPAEVRKARIETLLEMVGLSGMGNRQIGTFSKGMARRIGLAQALINDPDLLILDEPTSGMDPMGTRQMKDLFVELTKRGKTILLCSHLLADVEDVCDRIGILYGGRMQVEGTVKELLQQRDETQIRIGKLSDQTLNKIKDIAVADGNEVDVTHPMEKLESFFVNIVAKARLESQATSGAEQGTGISGFLAEKPVVRQDTILDQLVSADVATEPEQQEASVATTQTTESQKAQAAATNTDLLQKLSDKPAETDEIGFTEIAGAQNVSPEEEEVKPAVKKDVLNDLIGKKDGGQTETTRPEDSEDTSNA